MLGNFAIVFDFRELDIRLKLPFRDLPDGYFYRSYVSEQVLGKLCTGPQAQP